jgi:hypothetical protein
MGATAALINDALCFSQATTRSWEKGAGKGHCQVAIGSVAKKNISFSGSGEAKYNLQPWRNADGSFQFCHQSTTNAFAFNIQTGEPLSMKRQFVLLVALIFISTSVATALRQDGGATKIEVPAMEIGKTLTDFTLTDLNGKPRTLESLKGKKGTLLLFVSTKCPYSKFL